VKVIIVVGLPGSGKTYYINNNKKEGDVVQDDFVTPENLKIILDNGPEKVFLADPNFCNEFVLKTVREYVGKYTSEIEVVYFENDTDKAINNAKKRDRRVEGMIYLLAPHYYPPKNSLKIFV